MGPAVGQFGTEERRIRAAYARRRPDAWQGWSDPSCVFILQNVERRLLSLLTQTGMLPLNGKRILEIGCGTGHWLREFVKWGARPADVAGVDLLSGRLADAKSMCDAVVNLFCCNAGELALRDASFDIVAQLTVFTSILDSTLKRQVAREMLRALKPGGVVIWYDFFVDNPANPDVRGVGRHEIHSLFPACEITLRRVTLAPPIVRRLAGRAWLLCSLLDVIPLLRTHYLGIIKKH